MSAPSYYNSDLKKELENKFLYDNDLNSLYLFLTLIENEYRFKGLKPKYISSKKISTSLRRQLSERDDKDLVVSSIMKLINDDINKLELAMYLDAYSMGFENLECVNKLENFVLKHMKISSLEKRNKLYHDNRHPRVRNTKKVLVGTIVNENFYTEYLNDFITNYCNKVIYNKIMQLNKYLNKQLILKYDDKKIYIVEEEFLTRPELYSLYRRILITYKRSMKKLSYDAVWYGVNDRVLARYQ